MGVCLIYVIFLCWSAEDFGVAVVGGGGGFFPVFEDFGRMFGNLFLACAFFFFFFQVKISLRTLISLFRPGSAHSGSAS